MYLQLMCKFWFSSVFEKKIEVRNYLIKKFVYSVVVIKNIKKLGAQAV